MIAQAQSDLEAQATPDHPTASPICRNATPRRSRAISTAIPQRITEADALIAYLQMLGTLVDFKLYDAKANIR